MSNDAISKSTFVRKFTAELHNKNVAVFAGAGLSAPAGYVNWRGLLRDIIQDLNLDPDKEQDLVTLAQYSINQAGESKTHLAQTIFSHFSLTKEPLENHSILASLPIHTFWTTNYDRLIEKALEKAKKIPDVKYTIRQLSVTRPDRDVVVYKMHGDVENPADAIISKDDYESYPARMGPFVTALRGDLVEKTFLFIGFSFTDPNIDYILSRVRNQFEKFSRHHYCIQKQVTQEPGETDDEFRYRELKQHYFIRDLKRFSIFTILVKEYNEITGLLREIESNYKRSSIFISGSAAVYDPWNEGDSSSFVHELSRELAAGRNRIITGFGLGVGGAVINGTLAHLSSIDKTVSDEDIVMRPFPQVPTGGVSLRDQWTSYRRGMLEYAGIAIFLFGNKLNEKGETVTANGMREEFDIALSQKVKAKPIPVGATGYMARELWVDVKSNFDLHFPDCSLRFKESFEVIGDTDSTPSEIIKHVKFMVKELQETIR